MFTYDVVIPVYKPGEDLSLNIRMLRCQTLPPGRIIITNTISGDDDFVRTFQQESDIVYREVSKNDFGHGRTRNLGASFSSADFLLFMTQDAVLCDEHVCENLMFAMADERVGAAYARQVARETASPEERYTRQFNYPVDSAVKSAADLSRLGIKTFFCSNVCAMYRRSDFDRLGGFPSDVDFNEDMIFASGVIRSGGKVAYVATAKVIHSHDLTFPECFSRYYELGVSQSAHPDVFGGVHSGGEGLRCVSYVIGSLIRSGNILRVPVFIAKSLCKYAGFLCGRLSVCK